MFGIWIVSLAVAVAAVTEPQKVQFADAVRIGMDRNVDARIAVLEIDRAEGLLAQARAASLPTLVGAGSYTQLDHNRLVGTTLSAAAQQLNGALVLTVPLVMPQQWGSWSHASTNVDVATVNQAESRRQAAIAVAHAYLAVITQSRLVEVSHHAVDTAKQHFDFAHTRYQGGIGNQLDELQADQEYANSEAQLHLGLTALAQTREALGIVMGIDTPVDVDDSWFLPPIPDPDALDDRATVKRPDIMLSQRRVDAATQIDDDCWLDYMPSLVAVGQPFLQDPPEATVPARGWQAQLLLTIPFFDGGARNGNSTQRAALRSESEERLENLLRTARSEIRVGYESLRHAEDARVVSIRANKRAQAAIVLSTEAYSTGQTDNLQVIDAERRGRDADTAAVIAEDTVRRARLALLIAAGRFPDPTW